MRETRDEADALGVPTTASMSSSRTCVPKAAVNALKLLLPEQSSALDERRICEKMVREAGDDDPSLKAAADMMSGHGVLTRPVTGEPTALRLLSRTDICLAIVRLTYHDGETDNHCVVYDGVSGRILDSRQHLGGSLRVFHHVVLNDECERHKADAATGSEDTFAWRHSG